MNEIVYTSILFTYFSLMFNGFISFVCWFLFLFDFCKILILFIYLFLCFSLVILSLMTSLFVSCSLVMINLLCLIIFVLIKHLFSTGVFRSSFSCAFSHEVKRFRKEIIGEPDTFFLLIFFNPRRYWFHRNVF